MDWGSICWSCAFAGRGPEARNASTPQKLLPRSTRRILDSAHNLKS